MLGNLRCLELCANCGAGKPPLRDITSLHDQIPEMVTIRTSPAAKTILPAVPAALAMQGIGACGPDLESGGVLPER